MEQEYLSRFAHVSSLLFLNVESSKVNVWLFDDKIGSKIRSLYTKTFNRIQNFPK